MKRIIVVFIIVVTIVLSGCHRSAVPSQQSAQSSATEPNYYTISPAVRDQLAPFFDVDKVHRPVEADILSITKGMHITDVIEVLGKPHWFSEGNELLLAWDSIEGGTYCILFRAEKPTSDSVSPLEHEMTHSIVIREALLLPPRTGSSNSSNELQTPTEQPVLTEPSDPNFS